MILTIRKKNELLGIEKQALADDFELRVSSQNACGGRNDLVLTTVNKNYLRNYLHGSTFYSGFILLYVHVPELNINLYEFTCPS